MRKKKREKDSNKTQTLSLELSTSEWEFIDDLAQSMVMIKIFTDRMQGDDSLVSCVIPMARIILEKINRKILEGRETALIEDFLKRLRAAILYRFNDHFKDLDLNIAAFLDPRFKDRFFNQIINFQLISSNLMKTYEELYNSHPELFLEMSIEEINKDFKLKRIKPDENEEEFWREFDNSNMLSERNDIELFRRELQNYIEEKRVPIETLPSTFGPKRVNSIRSFQY